MPFCDDVCDVLPGLLCLAIGLCFPWVTANLIQPGVTALMGAKMPLM